MSAIAVLPLDSHLVHESERGRRAYPMSREHEGRAMGLIVPYRAWLAWRDASDPVAPMAPYIHIQGELRRLVTVPGDAPFVSVDGLMVDKLDYAPEDCPLVDVLYDFDLEQVQDLVAKGLYTPEFQSDDHVPEILTKAVYECPVACRFRVMWDGPAMWSDVLDRAREVGNTTVAAEAERALAAFGEGSTGAVPVIFCEVDNPGAIVMTRMNSGYALSDYFQPVKGKAVEADFEAVFADGATQEVTREPAEPFVDAPAMEKGEPTDVDRTIEEMAERAEAALKAADAETEAMRQARLAEHDTSLPEGFEDILGNDFADDVSHEDETVEETFGPETEMETRPFDIRDIFAETERAETEDEESVIESRVRQIATADAERRSRSERQALMDALFGDDDDKADDGPSAAELATEAYEEGLSETMARNEMNENTNAYLVADGSMSLDEAGNRVDASYIGPGGLAELAADYGSADAEEFLSALDDDAREVAKRRVALDRDIPDAPADPSSSAQQMDVG